MAKVGLKFVAASTKLASHVVALVPGGKVVGEGLSGVSEVADFAGDQINVKLNSKLETAMEVMDKVEHPLGE